MYVCAYIALVAHHGLYYALIVCLLPSYVRPVFAHVDTLESMSNIIHIMTDVHVLLANCNLVHKTSRGYTFHNMFVMFVYL